MATGLGFWDRRVLYILKDWWEEGMGLDEVGHLGKGFTLLCPPLLCIF